MFVILLGHQIEKQTEGELNLYNVSFSVQSMGHHTICFNTFVSLWDVLFLVWVLTFLLKFTQLLHGFCYYFKWNLSHIVYNWFSFYCLLVFVVLFSFMCYDLVGKVSNKLLLFLLWIILCTFFLYDYFCLEFQLLWN